MSASCTYRHIIAGKVRDLLSLGTLRVVSRSGLLRFAPLRRHCMGSRRLETMRGHHTAHVPSPPPPRYAGWWTSTLLPDLHWARWRHLIPPSTSSRFCECPESVRAIECGRGFECENAEVANHQLERADMQWKGAYMSKLTSYWWYCKGAPDADLSGFRTPSVPPTTASTSDSPAVSMHQYTGHYSATACILGSHSTYLEMSRNFSMVMKNNEERDLTLRIMLPAGTSRSVRSDINFVH